MKRGYGDKGDMGIRILAAEGRDSFLSHYLPHPHIPLHTELPNNAYPGEDPANRLLLKNVERAEALRL